MGEEEGAGHAMSTDELKLFLDVGARIDLRSREEKRIATHAGGDSKRRTRGRGNARKRL